MNVFFDVNLFSEESDSDEEDYVNILFRRPRTIRMRRDTMNYFDDLDFIKRFRLSKNTVENLLDQISHLIRRPTMRNAAVTPIQQLLLCLRFYATGAFQILVGDDTGIHQSTASKIIKNVTRAICLLKQNYVTLPEEDEVLEVQQGFFGVAGFPRVLLLLDGTHIRIQNPGGDQGEWFRNRKGFFLINAMVACDHNLKIRNIVARWPGTSNDMNVFMNSQLKAHFEAGMHNRIIIGDSGYAVEKYFMTPLDNPITPAEIRYQESITAIRNGVERCIGIWKRRFPCLALGLRTKLETTQDIIVATSILHNLALNFGDEIPPVNPEIEALINEEVPNMDEIDNDNTNAYRRELIEQAVFC